MVLLELDRAISILTNLKLDSLLKMTGIVAEDIKMTKSKKEKRCLYQM